MRYDPFKCPACDLPAVRVQENVIRTIGIELDDGGRFIDYCPDDHDEVWWESSEAIEDATGRHTLECDNAHEWKAVVIADEIVEAPGS